MPRIGTAKENMQDMAAKGRGRKAWKPKPPPTNPWTTCSNCSGHGHTSDINGELECCRACGGDGTERLRDSKGRYATVTV